MFWWIIGVAVGITAVGGWRMYGQGRGERRMDHAELKAGHAAEWTEAPETMESLLIKRMDRRLSGMEDKLEVMMNAIAGGYTPVAGASLAAVVKERDKPVADQYQTQLDQIVRLAERGTSLEDIAKKMKMHKGEVQLLLNLSKKSS